MDDDNLMPQQKAANEKQIDTNQPFVQVLRGNLIVPKKRRKLLQLK
jgi:hypothetical protein